MLEFFAPGVVAGQGSKRVFGKGQFTEASPNVAPFRAAIAYAAIEAVREHGWQQLVGVGCEVELDFYIAAPKKAKYPYPPRPDVDKAIRAVLDALTGIVFKDDSQVVDVSATKNYTSERAGTYPGVQVRVYAWPDLTKEEQP